jgi:Na+-translocating ferredoxin:NAD+ oxidoreductase RnfG subunit
MSRLLTLLLFSGLSVGVGLVAVDATRSTVAEINEITAQRCAALNSVLPDACVMP